jgi:hypothetical protein
MELTCVIYVSTAPRKLRQGELEAILVQSRRNNERDGVTGMLIYADGSFIQAVEGPAESIDTLLARLHHDERHRDILVIARYPVAQRQFPDWSMGFRSMERPRADELAAAFSDLRSPIFDGESASVSSIAHKLLEGFREQNPG